MEANENHRKPYWIIFSAGLFFVYEYIQMTIFNTMPQQLMTSFHISAYTLSKLSSCYFLTQVILLIPAGIFLDRFSVKKMILIAMGVSISGTFLLAMSTNYPLAVIARLLSGVGGAFAFLSCIKLAANWAPKKIAFFTGILITLAVFGGFIAQTPFAWVTHFFSWRTSLEILSGIGFLIWINIALNVQDVRTVHEGGG